MCRTLILLLVLLGLCLSPAVQAANVIVVTGTRDIDSDSVQDDLDWATWLEALGHTVDFQADNWTTLDDDKIAALEAADLIVFSRGSSSGNYNTDATEIEQWNAITTPIILMNCYVARSSRWLWINSTTINNLEGPLMEVQVPEHPIFTGVTLDASGQVAVVDDTTGSGQTSFIGSTDVGSGTLLASTGSNAWIVEWQPEAEFYSGSGEVAGGGRMLFCAGTQEVDATPQGAFNLTEEGELLFSNMVRYMLGEDIEPGRASAPDPEDAQTDVATDVILGWMTGENVVGQDVYFGTSLDAVSTADRTNPMDVLVSEGQAGATYDPEGVLDYGQTYYWRVDGFEADGTTMYLGDVWSFTVEPSVYLIESIAATAFAEAMGSEAERTIDGSGLDANGAHSADNYDMWLGAAEAGEAVWIQYEFDRTYKLSEMRVWNYNIIFEMMLGYGFKDVTVEYSVDGTEWMVLAEVEFAQGTSMSGYTANTVVDMGGVKAKYVRLTANSNFMGNASYGLSEVQFLYVPAQARYPEPADGQTEVNPEESLLWRAGRDAASHDVYFGTDEPAVADGTAAVDSVTESRFDPGSLDLGTAYYWRVDEVNEAGDRWEGDLWSFVTREYFVIDDFENYNDEDKRIYDTWADGWVNGTGMTVGYFDAPFAEREVVRGGRQSMPLQYDNTLSPYYSEAEFTVTDPDWTAHGADTLTLYFQGLPTDFYEVAADQVVMGSAGTDIWDVADECRLAYKPLDGNGSIVVRIDSLAQTDPWAKAGAMIRVDAEAGAINAFAFVTADGRVGWQYREAQDGETVSTRSDSGTVTMPHWVRLSREGDLIAASHSSDGVTWEPVVESENPDEPSSLEIPMDSAVLIGLAVTSHNEESTTSVEFAAIETTGGISGSWQVATIGPEQAEGNDPGQLYVAIADGSGSVQVVNHPSGSAATLLGGAWQEWRISFDDLTDVDLSRVETVYLGVGDRDNPAAGGAGTVYIDDVLVGHPLAK